MEMEVLQDSYDNMMNSILDDQIFSDIQRDGYIENQPLLLNRSVIDEICIHTADKTSLFCLVTSINTLRNITILRHHTNIVDDESISTALADVINQAIITASHLGLTEEVCLKREELMKSLRDRIDEINTK